MGKVRNFLRARRLTRDALLLCFSAFFADLGYQGVAALFPLYIVFELHEPVYWYGLITAIAFGGGSLFAYVGGLIGDRFDKKYVSIAGNAFIPLLAFSGLAHVLWLSALLFVLGWWARYFRTPARRALLVNVTPPQERAMAFGVLHALDIAGGMFSALLALLLLVLRVPIGVIMLWATPPLLVSTGLLFFVGRKELYSAQTSLDPAPSGAPSPGSEDRGLLVVLLIAASLYGFSFYNLGFPILTAASGHPAASGYALGVLAYVIYLGVSAVSGYALGAQRGSPLRSLWLFGYLPSALGSGLIGLSVLFHLNGLAFYLSLAILGAGMGGVETFEPTLVSSVVGGRTLSRGMGFLSVSRSVGQFASNLVMGLLLSLSPSLPYFYAFGSALLATLVLGAAYSKAKKSGHQPA